MQTLRVARMEKSLTAQVVAMRARISPNTLSRAEHGKPIRYTTFVTICAAIGVSPEEIIGVKLYSMFPESVSDQK